MLTGELPILSLMIMTLPVGALLIWITPDKNKARWIALLTALVDLALAILALTRFDHGIGGFQLVEQASWIPKLNIQYKLGIDGISVLFLPVTILLFLGVIISSWNNIKQMPRLYFSLLLLLESATLGIFCALDTMLFFLFWELTLIPLFFLISLWGIGPYRRYAAVKYTLFMLAGGIPLLFGFLLLAFNQANIGQTGIPAGLSFDYIVLVKTKTPVELQTIVFFLLLIGFAFKTPIFPLHTWLPTVSMQGPVSITAFLIGLKLGAYGIIRFVVPLAPDASQQFSWLFAGLGVLGILYGALAALSQTNLRRMLAYASISHVGLVLLGISAFNLQGIQGAIFQLFNFTVISGGLFLLTGILYNRVGSTDLINLGGIAQRTPVLASIFFLLCLASLGIPGTNGFVAEFLIIFGALKSNTGTGIAALAGLVITAGYTLTFYRKTFFGPITNTMVNDIVDLRGREIIIFVFICTVVLYLGIYPQAFLDMISESSKNWILMLK